MSHVDDGQLNALLDGELSPDEVRSVEAHVATCADCARRLAEARAFLSEAGALLDLLTPPGVAAGPAADATPPLVAPLAAGPAPANPPRPGEAPAGPRIARTAKEVAVSIDGRTELTPAIRPVFPHEVPAPQKPGWKLPDLEKLAWAASIVLAVGVGYLANEVAHQNTPSTTALTAPDIAQAPRTAAPAEGQGQPSDALVSSTRQRAAQPSAEPAASRRSAGPASRVHEGTGAAGSGKPPEYGKPSPAVAQSPTNQFGGASGAGRRDEQLAQAQPPVPTTTGTLNAPAAPSRERAARPALSDAAASGTVNLSGSSQARTRAAEEPRAAANEANLDAAESSFRTVRLEEAVRVLSGSIRLIDGMNPSRVVVGPGQLVPGANPSREVVRVIYAGAHGQILLDQQTGEVSQSSLNGLMVGDTLVTSSDNGMTQVRWVDRKFWLSLSAPGTADSVRALVERIR